jgi:hypothetical protein
MTIYVVVDGEYSDYHICGIFSSRELANKYREDCKPREGGEIEEWKVDEHVGKIKRTLYRCEMPGARTWDFDQIDLPSLRVPEKNITIVGDKFWADSYVSSEHARKLGVEEEQRRLRER